MTADLFASSDEPVLPFALPQLPGYAVHWDEATHVFVIDVPDGQLLYAPNFIARKISDRAVAYFLENDRLDPLHTDWSQVAADDLAQVSFANIQWRQDYITMFGKTLPLPRLTSWYGDAGKSYTYSGITTHPNPWNEGLAYFKQRIEALTGLHFNSVLLNWYRNGEDHLHWHADDEAELGHNPCIASLNFGEARDFLLKRRDDGSKLCIPSSHGSLLVMRGGVQHHWLHAVPKRKRVQGSRFNLTFRVIHPLK